MNKRKPICGITVSEYYLDKNMYSVAKLSIAKTKNGVHIWYVTEILSTYRSYQTAVVEGVRQARLHAVPLFYGIKKGWPLLLFDQHYLEKKGLLVP